MLQKHNQTKAPLPFPQWLEKHYPKNTPARSFLKMIGALDLAYLMYRAKTPARRSSKSTGGTKKVQKKVVPQVIPAMPLKVEDYKKPAIKKSAKPRTKKPAKPEVSEELTIEFEHKPEPIKEKVMEPVVEIEPEPLILNEEPIIEKPAKPSHGKTMWLDNEHLEDADLRKTHHKLETNGIAVAFETLYGDDEEETALVVNNVSWRALLTSPALNLSKMVQIVRATYGEVYILGRMALGAMSGEGYVSSHEATRIVETLASAKNKTIDVDVEYHDKDATSKKRGAHTIRIRFERLS